MLTIYIYVDCLTLAQQLNDYKGFNAELDYFKYRRLFSSQRHHSVNWLADSGDGKIFRCKKDSSTPSCLLNPCEYSIHS